MKKLFILPLLFAALLCAAQTYVPLNYVATASGTDTYTASPTPAITSYVTGYKLAVKFTNANSGASTINLNSKGPKAIKKQGSTALSSGDIASGQIAWLIYDGTNFQIVSGGSGAGGFTNPMTTAGDLIVGGSSGTPARLAMGAAYQNIRVNAGGTAVEYYDPTSNPMTTVGDMMIGGTVVGGFATPTRVGATTSGYVWTANGVGVTPSWQASSGGLSGLTTNRIAVATSSSTIGDFSELTFSGRTLTVGAASAGVNILNFGIGGSGIYVNTSTGEHRFGVTASHYPTFYGNNAEAARFYYGTNNFLINSTTDNAVSKLQVNGNASAVSATISTTSTATAAGTTTLTVSSTGIQIFTGSTTQTVTLPVVTTLLNGFMYRVVNLSSGVVTVQTSGSNSIKALAANSFIDLWVKDTTGGTGTASWSWFYNSALNN